LKKFLLPKLNPSEKVLRPLFTQGVSEEFKRKYASVVRARNYGNYNNDGFNSSRATRGVHYRNL
jgi:hypothetical protein